MVDEDLNLYFGIGRFAPDQAKRCIGSRKMGPFPNVKTCDFS